MTDTQPQFHLRTDVAFSTAPDDPTPAWVDLSARTEMGAGVRITRGRTNEYEQVQPGRASVTFTNKDGALTPENVTSPYYPDVLPQKRLRVTYRDPATNGTRNLVPAEDASFEGGTTGNWGTGNGATISNSATHAVSGTKGLRIAWPTAGAGSLPWGQVNVSGLVQGRQYTAAARVWTSDSPNPQLGVYGVVNGAATSTKSAFATITVTFTATANTHLFLVFTGSATTSGQFCWVDGFQIDEGASIGAFSLTSPWTDGTIDYRFDGYVDEWPIEWPGGMDTYANSTVTATDVLSRLGSRRKLQSVVAETILHDDPVVYYQLGEPEESLSVSDSGGSADARTLTIRQCGTGGSLTFAANTGAPTDGMSAPAFAPTNTSNGKFIGGPTPILNFTFDGSGTVTLECAALTSASVEQFAAVIADNWGTFLAVGFDASGHALARLYSPGLGGVDSVSSGTFNDGATHHLAVTAGRSGGTTTIRLVVDGTLRDTDGLSAYGLPWFRNLYVGGYSNGACFTGSISHVAVTAHIIADAALADHYLAETTGFAGERSDERIARIAMWCGIPDARLDLDVGDSDVAHLECTGLNPLEYMRKVEATEGGVLFAGRDGLLRFLNRSSTYTATAPDVSVPSYMVGANARLAENLQLVANIVTGSREGGAAMTLKDEDSIDAYGEITASVALLATTDLEVEAATGWRLSRSKDPQVRFTNLTLDGLTDSTYSPTIRAGIDIGAHAELTAMPAQAPAATIDQIVQGYAETISTAGWDFDANTTPYLTSLALVADDTGPTRADGPGVAVY